MRIDSTPQSDGISFFSSTLSNCVFTSVSSASVSVAGFDSTYRNLFHLQFGQPFKISTEPSSTCPGWCTCLFWLDRIKKKWLFEILSGSDQTWKEIGHFARTRSTLVHGVFSGNLVCFWQFLYLQRCCACAHSAQACGAAIPEQLIPPRYDSATRCLHTRTTERAIRNCTPSRRAGSDRVRYSPRLQIP